MTSHNLPNPSPPFVGREKEITEISGLLDEQDCRLISLLGPGGIGKTRLSIEIARQKRGCFTDGVFFVALQPLVSHESIVSAIASAVQFDFHDEDDQTLQEQLLDYLMDKQLLLVMDNFDHVLDGAELVTAMLSIAPDIKILVTSREALKLRQEWIRPVAGMPYPDDVYVREIDAYSAVQLFINRAQQLRRHFEIEDELPHIIRICQLVGGMPLGIELAVAWLKTLTCAEIASELQKNVDLLTAQMRDMPERHQSARAVFDSTWQMLTAEEQSVFMRLSVFRGASTRQAIQAVTKASLMALSGLVDKALLIPTENGQYQIHELLRQYAHECLEASDERDKLQDAHSDYYLRFMQERLSELQGGRQVQAVNEITADFDNIRAAWDWALHHMNYDGIGGAIETLCSFLHIRSRWKHDSHLVTRAEERFAPQAGEQPHPVWGMILSRNYVNHTDPIAALHQALDIAREFENQTEIGMCLHLMGHAYMQHVHMEAINHAEAIRYFEACIPYFEAVNDQFHIAASYGMAAMCYRLMGDYENSQHYNEKSLVIRREIGDVDGQTYATAELSNIMFIVGDLQAAEHYRREAILLAEQIESPWNMAWQKWELALYTLIGDKGDLQQAQQTIKNAQQTSEGYHLKGALYSRPLAHSLLAGLCEDYDTAQTLGKEAIQHVKNDAWYPLYSWGVLVAACGRGDYDTVRHYTCELLKHFWALRVIPFVMMGVAFTAILSAYQDKNPRRATELLALASTHRGSLSGWLKAWAFIDRLQNHLEIELATTAYQTAWEHGQTLAWDDVVEDLLAEYENRPNTDNNDTIPAHILSANAGLLEPLSERELEVLLKIAEGHSNRAIAEQLYVGVSTVKKHITHIYGKLQIESRTQALLRAQELNLVE